MRSLLLASALIAGLFGSLDAGPAPVPHHAFCRTLWLFGLPCADVCTKLLQQIRSFSPFNGCEKCHYGLISSTNESIHAYHTSSYNLHTESIQFTLHSTVPTGSCHVTAQSASLAVNSLLDNSLNYCNLRDLLTASGLNFSPGFMEVTSEWACRGSGFAPCST